MADFSVTTRASDGGRSGLTRLVDPVWGLTAAIVVLLLLVDRAQGVDSIAFVLGALIDILPFLAVAIGAAAYAKASGADALIARAFQGRIALMILAAALIGALSPFCSCGVIPLIAALLAMGVPLAAVMAFWLSSPIMDPSMFVLTAGTLGLPFALAKTAAAVGLGLFGGFGILAGQRLGMFEAPLRDGIAGDGCAARRLTTPSDVAWTFWNAADRRTTFGREALSSFLFLAKWLTIAFLLESLMMAYVPAGWIATAVGGDGVGPIVIAALVGIPAYLNGYAALPLVGGLIESGMSPGAGMAFLVAGGVSSIPAAVAVYALVKAPVFTAYLGFALIGSILAGVVFLAI
ncbi:MAG: permease [Alphaproteobacteria bacterium]|nr:permease [Alphaproteobacteria bacterium]